MFVWAYLSEVIGGQLISSAEIGNYCEAIWISQTEENGIHLAVQVGRRVVRPHRSNVRWQSSLVQMVSGNRPISIPGVRSVGGLQVYWDPLSWLSNSAQLNISAEIGMHVKACSGVPIRPLLRESGHAHVTAQLVVQINWNCACAVSQDSIRRIIKSFYK